MALYQIQRRTLALWRKYLRLRVDITLSRGRLTQLLAGSLDLKHQAPTSAPDDLLGLTVPVGLKRAGREMRMLVENADNQPIPACSESWLALTTSRRV